MTTNPSIPGQDTPQEQGASLLELAERCERAEGPNFELEQQIGAAIGLPNIGEGMIAPAYTASLDAAMTLVPEGIYPIIDCLQHDGGCEVELGYLTKESDNGFGGLLVTSAATPALALCAAAVRARAADAPKGGEHG